MLEAILQKKRYERWPEDSGEWTPVPLEFKHLTPPSPSWGLRDAPDLALKPLRKWANLLPLIQLALGSGLFFLGACLPDAPDSIWWIFTVPVLVGFFSAMCVVLNAAGSGKVATGAALCAIMRGQIWWGLLLFIPCYGWGVLMLCVPPCTVATLMGTLAACAIRTRNDGPVTP